MAKLANVTTKNFSAKLRAAFNSRDSMQLLAEFGIAYLMTSPDKNCLYLSQLRNAIKVNHGFNVAKFEDYITARVNVTKSKDKNGNFIFKSAKNAVLVETPIEGNWYEYTKPSKAGTSKIVDLDTVRSRLTKISESGIDKVDAEAHAASVALCAYMNTAAFRKAVAKGVADRESVLTEK